MFKDREKMYQVYHSLLSMSLSMALVLAVNQYYELRVHVLLCALFSIAMAFLVYLFDNNRRNTISYLLLLSIFPVVLLFYRIRNVNPIKEIKDLYNWCMEYNYTEELYIGGYAHFVIFGIAIMSAILFYILVKIQISKIILSIAILAMIIFLAIQSISINKMVVGICIFYIVSILVEYIGKIYVRKVGRKDKKAGILYLAPICLLLAVLSVSLPSNNEPIKWTGVKNLYYNIKDKVDSLMLEWDLFKGDGPEEFTLSMTGYSEESGNLGSASLSKNDRIALMISSKKYPPIYLIGSVSDIYTGTNWEKTRRDQIEGQSEHVLDYTEMLLSLSRIDTDVLENNRWVDRRMVKTEYDYLKTKTLFYPLKTSWLEILKSNSKINKASVNITFDKAEGKGTNYQFVYYEMNLKGEAFREYLKGINTFSYDVNMKVDEKAIEWVERELFYYDNQDSILKIPDIYNVLNERAQSIKEQYTGLPENLPNRVKELALEITKDYETDYEKLKAIEAFLGEYEYTLRPGKMPKGRDFVDYFLFDNLKGYCTAYASAMAVLGRCIGIPTRYVEGFLATLDESGYSVMQPVRNDKAHAWAEAYLEGFGWIPLEATATYYDSRYVQWRDVEKSDNQKSRDESYYEQHPEEFTDETIYEEPKDSKNESSYLLVGFIIVTSAIMVVFVLLVIYYNVLKYKYKKMFMMADYNDRVYMLFLRIIKLLGYEGFRLEEQETVLMFSQRVKDRYHYKRITFYQVAEIFMRYRYSDASITKKDYKAMEVFYEGLKKKHREEIGRGRIVYEEFIFLMGMDYA